jgi:RNA polymerase sigma-70 factor (ECF subfamily)
MFIRCLYQENRANLLRYVVKFGRVDQGIAEDIVQETFLRAWKNIAKLDTEVNALKPWLFAVARNLVIDMARAKKARPQETDDIPHQVPAVPDCTDEVLAAVDMANTLAELSAPHREVLVLLHCLDRSIPQTARSIGVPTGTVKSRNHYALKELRRAAGLVTPC